MGLFQVCFCFSRLFQSSYMNVSRGIKLVQRCSSFSMLFLSCFQGVSTVSKSDTRVFRKIQDCKELLVFQSFSCWLRGVSWMFQGRFKVNMQCLFGDWCFDNVACFKGV